MQGCLCSSADRLQIEAISVPDVCRASLQFVQELALKKQIQLGYDLSDELAIVEADSRRLKQMLVNLLSNAVKFTPSGGTVCLEVQVTPEPTNLIRFAVRDTGVGIAPDDLARLFQSFVQVDSHLDRQHEGSGRGLALVCHLAELHGGTISVESELGVGSCFTITLPYHRPKAVPTDDAAHGVAWLSNVSAEPSLQAKDPQPPPTPMCGTIMLVDDSEESIEATLAYLQAKGYFVIVAHNGREALDLAEQMHPEVILLDIQMPEIDGLEVARRLRSRPATATTPIIALTALAMPGDRERCLEAGADDYFSKPVSLRQLLTRIEQLRGT